MCVCVCEGERVCVCARAGVRVYIYAHVCMLVPYLETTSGKSDRNAYTFGQKRTASTSWTEQLKSQPLY